MYKPNTRYSVLQHRVCGGYAAGTHHVLDNTSVLQHRVCGGYAAKALQFVTVSGVTTLDLQRIYSIS